MLNGMNDKEYRGVLALEANLEVGSVPLSRTRLAPAPEKGQAPGVAALAALWLDLTFDTNSGCIISPSFPNQPSQR